MPEKRKCCEPAKRDHAALFFVSFYLLTMLLIFSVPCAHAEADAVPVQSLKLQETSVTLLLGAEGHESYQLMPVILPENATDQELIWASSDEAVAIVDKSGKVSAVSPGKATITATTTDPSLQKPRTASCRITVQQAVTEIHLDTHEAEISRRGKLELGASVLPDNASNRKVTWTSSDPKVAAVSARGAVSPKSPGTCIISCEAADGSGVSDTCTVTVFQQITGLKPGNGRLKLAAGQQEYVAVQILPEDAKYRSVSWETSDPSVVTAEDAGDGGILLTGKWTGNAKVTGTADDGSGTKTVISVQVTAPDYHTLPTISWQGYELTPMHYEIFSTDEITEMRIRFACTDVPRALLYEHMNQFRLADERGSPGPASSCMIAEEGMLQQRDFSETTCVFDVCFTQPYSEEDPFAHVAGFIPAGSEDICPLPPRGREAPERCCFRTEDGTYVISLYTEEAEAQMLALYSAEMRNRDVRMILGGTFFPVSSDEKLRAGRDFLYKIPCKTLALTVSKWMDIDPWYTSGSWTLTEITSSDQGPGIGGNFQKCTYRLEDPDSIRYDHPPFNFSCKELNFLIGEKGIDSLAFLTGMEDSPFYYAMSFVDTLNILTQDENLPMTDPALRCWMMLLQEKPRDQYHILVNGKDIGEYDFDTDLPAFLERNRSFLGNYLLSQCVKHARILSHENTPAELNRNMFRNRKAVVILKRNLVSSDAEFPDCPNTLDPDSGDQDLFSRLPDSFLASSVEEADLVIVIYNNFFVDGAWYSGNQKIRDAYGCTTYLMVFERGEEKTWSYSNWTKIAGIKVASDLPRNKQIWGKNLNDGSPQFSQAIDQLLKYLD